MTARPQPEPAGLGAPAARAAPAGWLGALAWACAGALLIALLTQIPARHPVDLGAYDAAYVQGFLDPERAEEPGGPAPYLAGSDGSARWSAASSALIFPQAGLPGEVTLRLRGWREQGPPPTVALLLNGGQELARLTTSGEWQELTVPVRAGALKATDFFVEIRAETAELPDGRAAGVLVDRAEYRSAGWPLLPYPAQLAYGAAAGALLWLLSVGGWRSARFRSRRLAAAASISDPAPAASRQPPTDSAPTAKRLVLIGLLVYGLAWTLLYRLQPPLYPYPLRLLPPLAVAGLAALWALRDGPALAARRPWLIGAAAPAAVLALWLGLTMLTARGHVTLARPGVENDFRVFATRETLGQVLSADGFYNLGYPLLLWLARPLFDGNAFLAGRLLAALSGAALLAGGYWLARALLPPGPALTALLALAMSGMVAQYGLYLGSDMPFAALAALCVAGVVAVGRRMGTGGQGDRETLALAGLAGLCGGMAFLVRHPGLLLLPWGLLALWVAGQFFAARRPPPTVHRQLIAFGLAFLLAAAPQLIVNAAQTGQPLYNQQAKNIWLAVFAGTDWGRWEEAPNSVGLAEVLLRDPGRFLANWWGNLVAYSGSGAEDRSEFGRAIQLRLLGWPANWLAVAGLLAWLWLALRAGRRRAFPAPPPSSPPLAPPALTGGLLLLVALYVAAVSTAFALPRFFLPLAPIYAAAAGWALWRAAGGGRALAAATLALVVVLWGGFAAGGRAVLADQPADEVAAVAMVEAAAPGEAPIAARVAGRLPLAKYSAIAHRVVDWPAGSDTSREVTAAELAELRAAGARYLLWDEAAGPPPLADPEAARVGTSPRYGLYDLTR